MRYFIKVTQAIERFGFRALPDETPAGRAHVTPRLIAGILALVFVGFMWGLAFNPVKAQSQEVRTNSKDIMELQFKAQAQAMTNAIMAEKIQQILNSDTENKRLISDLRSQLDRLIWTGFGFGTCISFLLMFPYLRATIFKKEGKSQ